MHGPWYRGAGFLAAALPLFAIWTALAVYSVAANFEYGQTIGAGEARDIISYGGALADIVKLILPLFCVALAMSKDVQTGVPRFAWPALVLLFSVWSLFCSVSLQMQAATDNFTGAIAARAQVERLEAQISGHDSGIERLTATLLDHDRRLANLRRELDRPRAAIKAELTSLRDDRIWARTSQCADATLQESIDWCARYRAKEAQAAAARTAPEIRADIVAETARRDATSQKIDDEGRLKSSAQTALTNIDQGAAAREVDPGLAMLVSWATPTQASGAPESGEDGGAVQAEQRFAALKGAIQARAIFFGALLEAAMAIVGVIVSTTIALSRSAFSDWRRKMDAAAAEAAQKTAEDAAAKQRAAKTARRRAAAATAAKAPRPGRRKLDDAQELEAFQLRYRGRSLKQLGAQFGVSATTISDAVQRVAERALGMRNDEKKAPAVLAETFGVSEAQIERALEDAVKKRKKAVRVIRGAVTAA